jgi:hypothetical protein
MRRYRQCNVVERPDPCLVSMTANPRTMGMCTTISLRKFGRGWRRTILAPAMRMDPTPRTAGYNCRYTGDSRRLGGLQMLIAGYQVHQLLIPLDFSGAISEGPRARPSRQQGWCPFISLVRVDDEIGEFLGMRHRAISHGALSAKSLRLKALSFPCPCV